MVETLRLCRLSIGHISRETQELLETLPPGSWPVAGGPYPGNDAFFIYAHDENGGTGAAEIPADLFACCSFARSQGCDYFILDPEAEVVRELPDYMAPPPTETLEEATRRANALARILRDMLGEAKALDDRLNGGPEGEDSKAPDGDDYNTLWSIIEAARQMAEPVMEGR